MAKRGRKSAAQLAVVPLHPGPSAIERAERPAPPNHLGDVERAVWESVVDSLPADWFEGGMLAVLEQYCAHLVEARRLRGLIEEATKDPDLKINDYDRLLKMRERESRAMASLATKMRITQQAARNHRGNRTREAVREPWES